MKSRGPTREEALARVLAYRERGRRRSIPTRALLATLGALLMLGSLPLLVILPEAGIPALLVGLRILAVEAQWAATAYAWIEWRFGQAHAWFHRQSLSVRAAVVAGLLAVAAILIWLLVHELL